MSTQSCAQCRAPMADDQRYCLHCGEPRPDVKSPLASGPADTRVQTPSTPPGIPVPPGIPGGAGDGTTARNSVALIAGVGVLLLAMGVGVLIGRAGTGSAKTSSPQVITVSGSGATGTGTTGTPTTTTPEVAKAPGKGKQKKEEEESKAPPGTGNSLSKPAPPSTLKNLRKGGSGQSYEQRSKNLPNVVGT